MADIFISYASKDLHRVEPLVRHLEEAGYSVWWDRQLQGGTMFSQEIEQEVKSAHVVLVVWSTASLQSRWVADEVDLALKTGKLVPIAVDGVDAPMGYRQIQTIDFSTWGDDKAAPCLETLFRAIAHHISEESKDKPQGPRHAGPAPEASIAVLPFADMSPDKDQEYFTEGISEELLNLLAKIPQMQVTARTSSFSFKGSDKQLSEIGEILGVAHILEGSMRKAGNRIRITAQLIKTATNFHVWSETFDRTLDDIFAIQDEIAASIVKALKGHILGDVAAPETAPSQNIEAYDLYLKGQQSLNTRIRPEMEKGRTYFEEALALDANYAPALVGLADAHLLLSNDAGCYGTTPLREAYDLATPLLEKALEVDPKFDEAFAIRAMAEDIIGNLEASVEDARKAIEINPNYARAYRMLSHTYLNLGDPLAHSTSTREKAIQLDPLSMVDLANHATELLDRGQINQAIEILERIGETNPEKHFSDMAYVGVELITGGYKDALARYKGNENLHHSKNGQWCLINILAAFDYGSAVENLDPSLALGIYCSLGQKDEANRVGPSITISPGDDFYADFNIAAWHSLSGRFEECLKHLEPYIDDDPEKWGPLFDSQLDFMGGRLGYLAAMRTGKKDLQAYFEKKLRGIYAAHLEDPYGPHHMAHYIGAILALADGDVEKALDEVETKLARTPVLAIEMAFDPIFEPLASDPRFIAAMEKSKARIASEKLAAFEAGLLPPGPDIIGTDS